MGIKKFKKDDFAERKAATNARNNKKVCFSSDDDSDGEPQEVLAHALKRRAPDFKMAKRGENVKERKDYDESDTDESEEDDELSEDEADQEEEEDSDNQDEENYSEDEEEEDDDEEEETNEDEVVKPKDKAEVLKETIKNELNQMTFEEIQQLQNKLGLKK